MEQYKYYETILCIGDKARYLFLNKQLPINIRNQITDEELYNNDIFILYNQKCYIEKYFDKRIIKIYINTISFIKVLYFPINYINIKEKNIDKLLIFTLFPYIKENIIEMFKYIISKYDIYDYLAILYREKRRFSATDLVSEEKAIENAKNEYLKININTIVYSEEEQKNEQIFNISFDLEVMLKNSFKNRYFTCKRKFERFQKDYDFYISDYFNSFSIINPKEYEKFNKIFTFSKVKESNNLWKTFIFNFKKYYIINEYGLLDVINDLYLRYVEDIYIGDINNELKSLDKYILKEYENYFGKEKILAVPNTELEYISLMNKSNEVSLDIKFKNKIKDFLQLKLKIILYEYIKKYIKKIGKKIENDTKA